MKKGKLVVLEGGEGAGKDTQMDLLQGVLDPNEYLFVRDPGSTVIGVAIRDIVLREEKLTPTAELLMYLASRVQMTSEILRPALEKGMNVISNRYDLSTIAYQVSGRVCPEALAPLKVMSEYILKDITTDLLIYLDCLPEIGIQRKKDEGITLDRFETEPLDFHQRVYDGYKEHLNEYNHVVIDGHQSKEDVHVEVMKALQTVI
ncbi:MAG: dTMP kinase [Candidatus Azotimanducaceae bacterium]|jgi:dTMP kinase